METATERVRRGAEFLDGAYPGWRARISPDILDLNGCQHCILGQVYGCYWGAIVEFGMADVNVRDDGTHYRHIDPRYSSIGADQTDFVMGYGFFGIGASETETLTEAWKETIREEGG
jgi:hypothetical protein